MRKTLGTILLGAGLAAAVLPATPASASCDVALYVLTGRCENLCTIVAGAYRTADRLAGDALPDVPFLCPA